MISEGRVWSPAVFPCAFFRASPAARWHAILVLVSGLVSYHTSMMCEGNAARVSELVCFLRPQQTFWPRWCAHGAKRHRQDIEPCMRSPRT